MRSTVSHKVMKWQTRTDTQYLALYSTIHLLTNLVNFSNNFGSIISKLVLVN